MAKTILVVDDDADTLTMVSDILEGADFTVLTAEGGRDALKVLGVEPVELIVLDLMMPAMDGFDFCRALSNSGLAKGVPIIVLTALDNFAFSQDFLAGLFGVYTFMYKPFQPSALLDNVRRALAGEKPVKMPEHR